jgi:conjugal transfer/entry exclusion protein
LFVAEKVTDYEDELRRLKTSSPVSVASAVPPTPGLSRFGSLLSGRKLSGSSTPTNEPASITRTNSLSQKETELAAQLAREQEARQKAEGKVSQMSHELEDLSVQLFQQANEMVATERRARAKLEERVVILERRDVEKRERLERLERALRRIDRVKNLLMAQDEMTVESLGGTLGKRVKT